MRNELKSKSEENKREKKTERELSRHRPNFLNTYRMSHATGMDSPVGKRN